MRVYKTEASPGLCGGRASTVASLPRHPAKSRVQPRPSAGLANRAKRQWA
jgi:hypothetical protein